MADAPQSDGRPADVTKALQHALNKHGHGFHYAVIRRIGDLWPPNRMEWNFEASEFPVGGRGNETHIDFILRRNLGGPFHDFIGPGRLGTYIVAECKRVDPAIGRWCFARAPFVSRRNRSKFVAEYCRFGRDGQFYYASGVALDPAATQLAEPYHIAMELRSDGQGDGTGRAIDSAFTQVIRGLNGFVDQVQTLIAAGAEARPLGAIVVPVVFTTAELYSTDVDLSMADLSSGRIELASAPAQRRPWVALQVNQSHSLRHSHSGKVIRRDLGEILEIDCARTVVVVSPNGIADFFAEFNPDFDSLKET